MIRRNTWIVLGIFAILLAGAWLYQRSQNGEVAQATPTAGVSLLFEPGERTITALRISNNEGTSVAMTLDPAGVWELAEPGGEPADENRVQSAVSQAGQLRILAPVESAIDRGTIGLDPAQYTVEVTYSDGVEAKAYFGDETPTASGYYAYLQDNQRLQVVNKFSVDSLLALLTDPPIAVPTSLPTLENEIPPTENP